MKIPRTPFSTRLSGSARETELRLRNIFQWKKKRPPVVLFVLTALVVLFCFGLVSCEPAEVPEELMNNIEHWVADYPWSEHSEKVNEDTRWLVESVKRTGQRYDEEDIRGEIYEVKCRSESGASELTLTLLVDPDTLAIYPEPESWTISGKEEPPQSPPNGPDVEEPQPTPAPEPGIRYTPTQITFADTVLGKRILVEFEWPEGWQTGDHDDSGEPGENLILSRDAIYGTDGSFIGTIGYNTFEPYEGEIDPALYYQTVYSGIRLGAHYFWEDFSLVAQTDDGETHRATVYYQKDNGGSAASWPTFEGDGICSYNKEMAVYIALEFQEGTVEDEVLSYIAESVRLKIITEPTHEAAKRPEEQTTGVTLAVEGLSEIGKTLAMIWSENPGFEYRTVQIPGAAGLCLKEIQDGTLCFFVGTHAGPSLQELGGEYADQLRCAGIVSTVGRTFPETVDGVSLERFFNGLGVAEYAHHTQDGSGQGWIEFSYGGYRVWIDTNGEGAHYKESSVMRHDYPLIVVDKEIEIANSAISDEYTGAAAVVDAYQYQKRLATLDGLDHMPLDELPQEILDSLTLVSEEDFEGMYHAEWGWRRVYTAPGLEIRTSAPSAVYLNHLEDVEKNNRQLFPTEEDFYAYIEGEEGREWLTSVIITEDSFATLDGLKVGMTRAQAKELGYALDEGTTTVGPGEKMLEIEVENGVIVRMSTVWMMGRYIGKFFEL